MSEPAWLSANRANWDERVAVHLGPRGYNLAPLRAGRGVLNPIEEAELPPVAGKRVLHLQCHFGADTLTLAQRGAEVTGLDFSPAAIGAARGLAAELGLRARFVEANLYDAPEAVPGPGSFDLVYVTWGALCWLPDVAGWARVAAHFVKPGGAVYLAEGHPAALVMDDATPAGAGLPGYFAPYLGREELVIDEAADYADPEARLAHSRTHQFIHPLSDVVNGLIGAGLRLEWLREHGSVPWRMFAALEESPPGSFRWPGKPWLPLAFSLLAARPIDGPAPPA